MPISGNVSFPGLGIGPFTVNSTAFSIFGKDIAWYGLIITVGIVLSVLYVIWRAEQYDVKYDHILDIALVGIPSGIVGARLYYVLTSLDRYDSFWDVFKIWEGGLAIYGGIIGGAIGVLVMARIKKINFFKLADMISPAIMIGQLLGRWGNFFNREAYGTETELPWRMGLLKAGEWIYVHPTFLYESLWNLVGFILINCFYGFKKDKLRNRYDGQIFLMVFGWYGLGRMFIEALRTDSLYVGPFRISQVVGAICFIGGLGLLLYHFFTKTDMYFRPLAQNKKDKK